MVRQLKPILAKNIDNVVYSFLSNNYNRFLMHSIPEVQMYNCLPPGRFGMKEHTMNLAIKKGVLE